MEWNPESALAVGDTHCDLGWMLRTVLPRARDLSVAAVIVVGDFGYWPRDTAGEWFLDVVRTGRRQFGVDVAFLDGNHEDFGSLGRDVDTWRREGEGPREPLEVAPGFLYLPRGARFTLGGRSCVVLGGAVSVDRKDRTLGEDWFPDERVTNEDLAAVVAGGPAEVWLSHDAPAGWDIPGVGANVFPSWVSELPAADEHRERLREAYDVVRPSLVVHGHYHAAYDLDVQESWGPVRVVGLNRNQRRSWGVVISAEHAGDWEEFLYASR